MDKNEKYAIMLLMNGLRPKYNITWNVIVGYGEIDNHGYFKYPLSDETLAKLSMRKYLHIVFKSKIMEDSNEYI